MRTVLKDNQEVAHVWAHHRQSEGRASRVFFNGDTIYSYGTHFPMGRIVERNGEKAVLITTDSYSVSTAKHIGYVRSATSHFANRFSVPLSSLADATPRKQFDTYMPRVLTAMKKASTARLRGEWYLSEARDLVSEGNRFAEFFGLKPRLEMPANIEEALAAAKAADTAAKAKARRQQAARNAKELKEALKSLEKWKRGESHYISNSNVLDQAYLRVSNDGKEIETSMHASVPIAHAHRAYKLLVRIHARNEGYKANGHTIRVGHYDVNSMDEKGHLVIGCHDIEWAEVERIAKLLNWDNTEPAKEPAGEVA